MRSLLPLLGLLALAAARTRDSFDFGWLFHLGDVPGWAPECDTSGFTTNLTGVQCYGMSAAAASDAASCAAQACNSDLLIWQWCPFGATDCDAPGECWIGSDCSNNATNSGTAGWVSMARTTVPPPQPVPPCTNASQPCNSGFPDTTPDWVAKNTPHDFVVDGQFSPTNDRGHGYLAGNVSWYRKHFTVDPSAQGQLIWLAFDGVFRNADVWLNNNYLGHHTEGYTSFHFYIHNASLNYGATENVLALRCDATAPELWSYEPGGIFRHVHIHTADPVSVVPWGFYTPSYVAGNITGGGADQQTADLVQLNPVVDFANAGAATADITFAFALLDTMGNTVAKASGQVSLGAGAWTRQYLSTTFGSPAAPVNLWNTNVPTLYNATLTLTVGGNVVDAVWERIGVRSAIFDPRQGFLLNGVPTKISGTSNHIDFGGAGGAVPDRVNEFRVATHRKVLGGNGWRTAHNPVAPEMLDFADDYGLLVWEENRFINAGVQPLAPKPIAGSKRGEAGIWAAFENGEGELVGATPSSSSLSEVSSTWWRRFAPSRNGGLWTGTHLPVGASTGSGPTAVDPQLLQDAQDMVLRDRNHPSIVIWSLCNEGGCEQGAPWGGVVFSQFLTSISWADTMRPVTGNTEWSPGSSDTFSQTSQVMSFSYNYGAYAIYKQFHPNKAVGGGESASCTSTRQYYLPSNSTSGYVNQNDFGCVQEAWTSAASLEYGEEIDERAR
jgi:beta-galactosidase/beta-glucuronidase